MVIMTNIKDMVVYCLLLIVLLHSVCTAVPTVPSAIPTVSATAPSAIPTAKPTATPTQIPTAKPTSIPTEMPTAVPTQIPTSIPTVTPTQDVITTIAGTGTSSYSGDGGAATSAALNYPNGVALDTSGTITITITVLSRTVTQYDADVVMSLE